MAQPEKIMAESSVIPEEAREVPKSQLVIVGSGGEYKGAYKPPEAPKPPEDRFLPREVEEEIVRKGRSEFDRTRMLYDHYMGSPIPLDPGLREELHRRQEQARQQMEQLEQEAEHHKAQPLREARKEMVKSYRRIKETRSKELQGGGRDLIIKQERAEGHNVEGLLEEAKELAPLMPVIRGLVPYLWEGINTAAAYEEKGIKRAIKNPFAEKLFAWVKRQRIRERMSSAEKRYTQVESYWGGGVITIFAWPENPREMILTAMDWVKDRIAAIGERDPATTNKMLEEIRGPGPTYLQNSLLRLNGERASRGEEEILETNPEYRRAIAFSEGPPDVFGNEMIMKKGNTEFGPQQKERFAAKFIENFNAMFLENRSAALLMHKLRTYKDGTYWTGHDWHVDKVEEGDIKDYRAKIQEELIGEAAALDFFTETIFANNQDLFQDVIKGKEIWELADNAADVKLAYKGFFELREQYKLQYSTNDPLERLLLDPGDVIRQRIAASRDAEALRRHDVRTAVFKKTKKMLDRSEGLDFISKAEIYKLEKRMRRPLSDTELTALAEVHKDILRAQLQQTLQSQGRNPDQYKDWIEQNIVKVKEQRRQEAIRSRIRARMEGLSRGKSYFAGPSTEALAQFDAAKQENDLAKYDQIAWEWVKNYNHYQIQSHLPKWYPSGWDKVRMKIDRAAKTIDRSLTEEEREAMYETAYLPKGDDEESIARRLDLIKGRTEDARFGFELARSFQIFMMESSLLGGMRIRMVMKKGPHAGEYIGRLDDDETSVLCGLIKGRINPDTREIEVERDANGEAIIIDPERKSIRIIDIVEARQAKAIADEEHGIEPLRSAKCQALKAMYKAELSGNQAEIAAAHQDLDKASKDLRDKLRDCQFVVTHAFKAKGLVDGRWPTWPHASALDNSGIKVFGEILAEYGVEIAPGLPFADYKGEIYEFLERERRGQFSEMDRAAQEFMEGKYPFYERDTWSGEIIKDTVPEIDEETKQPKKDAQGNIKTIKVPRPVVSIFTMSDPWGEPPLMTDRMRVVNKGDVAENTMITEAEFNTSTSGGVKFLEYISHASTRFLPLGISGLGSRGIWNLNNFIKRRNEVEYHKQKLLDPTDMPKNARAQAAAYKVLTALKGGSLGEGQSTPGFLNEPFNGAFTIADWYRKIAESQKDFKDALKMKNTHEYVDLIENMRAGKVLPQDLKLEQLRQLTYEDYDQLAKNKDIGDDFYQITYKTFGNFVTWLKAEKEVEQNRIGNAPRNYAYDNTKRWYAFRRLMRESMTQGDRGFIQRLGYSPEIASELSIKQLEVAMQDADYLILRDYERERLAQEGAMILSKVLTPEEKNKGRVLLHEVNWQYEKSEAKRKALEAAWKKERPEVKKALETVRRRGLLEFMQEEGFSWYTKLGAGEGKGRWQYKRDELQYLGERVPEVVRSKTNGTKVIQFNSINVMRYAAA